MVGRVSAALSTYKGIVSGIGRHIKAESVSQLKSHGNKLIFPMGFSNQMENKWICIKKHIKAKVPHTVKSIIYFLDKQLPPHGYLY